jgi:hypothetical protein
MVGLDRWCCHARVLELGIVIQLATTVGITDYYTSATKLIVFFSVMHILER